MGNEGHQIWRKLHAIFILLCHPPHHYLFPSRGSSFPRPLHTAADNHCLTEILDPDSSAVISPSLRDAVGVWWEESSSARPECYCCPFLSYYGPSYCKTRGRPTLLPPHVNAWYATLRTASQVSEPWTPKSLCQALASHQNSLRRSAVASTSMIVVALGVIMSKTACDWSALCQQRLVAYVLQS